MSVPPEELLRVGSFGAGSAEGRRDRRSVSRPGQRRRAPPPAGQGTQRRGPRAAPHSPAASRASGRPAGPPPAARRRGGAGRTAAQRRGGAAGPPPGGARSSMSAAAGSSPRQRPPCGQRSPRGRAGPRRSPPFPPRPYSAAPPPPAGTAPPAAPRRRASGPAAARSWRRGRRASASGRTLRRRGAAAALPSRGVVPAPGAAERSGAGGGGGGGGGRGRSLRRGGARRGRTPPSAGGCHGLRAARGAPRGRAELTGRGRRAAQPYGPPAVLPAAIGAAPRAALSLPPRRCPPPRPARPRAAPGSAVLRFLGTARRRDRSLRSSLTRSRATVRNVPRSFGTCSRLLTRSAAEAIHNRAAPSLAVVVLFRLWRRRPVPAQPSWALSLAACLGLPWERPSIRPNELSVLREGILKCAGRKKGTRESLEPERLLSASGCH